MPHRTSNPPPSSRQPTRTRWRAVVLPAALALVASMVPASAASGQPSTTQAVVQDTSSSGYAETGRWLTSGLDGSYGPTTRYARPTSSASSATWQFEQTADGRYDVYVWYPAHENRASDSPFTVSHADGIHTHRVDQRVNGSQWNLLDTYEFTAASPPSITLTNDADGVVGADAVAVVPEGDAPPAGPEPPPADIMPHYRESQVLFDADPSGTTPFLAFPTLTKVNNNRVLVSYKRGDTHSQDPNGAAVETITFDPRTEQVVDRTTTGETPGVVYQNAQYVPMPNGDVHLLVDRQRAGSPVVRIGVESFVSTDGGDTFASQGPFDMVDGYQYGYAFDHYTDGGTVYVLVMAFPDLGAPGREVHVIKTDDNGASWQFVANLTENLGLLFNESALERYGDGFLVAARADSGAQAVLFRTDADFQKLGERNLTASYPNIPTIGRPRLIADSGQYYLLGLSRPPGESILKLHHLDPETLHVDASIQLAHTPITTDSYYSENYTQVSDGVRYLNVVVQEWLDPSGHPNIVRHEFRWDELRLRLNEDFDDVPPGQRPDGWAAVGPDAAAVAPVPSPEDQSLRIVQESLQRPVTVSTTIRPARNEVVAEYSVLPRQDDAGFATGLSGKFRDLAAAVEFADDGAILAHDADVPRQIGSYDADTWYRIEIVASPSAQTFDVAIDGSTVAEDVSFRGSASTLTRFEIIGGEASTGILHLDDVVVH